MNREQKAAVIDEVATQIQESDAVFAVDYRGLSVTDAVELRARLGEVDAGFRVVKNRLTLRAADKAGAESLKGLLEGPTAFAFVHGDAALAAKAIANFRRARGLMEFKGGTMDGEPLTVDQLESIARLPGRDQLQGQFVGVLASPLTGLVRGLGSMIQGLALQLGQIRERGLVGGEVPDPPDGAAADEAPAAGGDSAEAASGEPEAGEGEVARAEDAGRAAEAEDEAPQAEGDAPHADGEEGTSGEAGGDGDAQQASDDQSEASDEA